MVPAALLAFLGCLAFFHCSEFGLACIFMRDELSLRSWLISKPYVAAMGGALVEFAVEAWLLPRMKIGWGLAQWAGLAMIVLGELIRKTGMFTAKASFTHNIRYERRPEHKLITWGIYRYIRHPGYLGWYIWCVGTQVLLANPVNVAVFAYVAGRFFQQRIVYEEYWLVDMFGPQYKQYAARTPTYIPFVR